MKKRVLIVHRGVDADPRCAKIIASLWKKNYDICFVGWDSTPSLNKPPFNNVPIKREIMNCRAPSGFKALLYFPIFFFHVYKHILHFRPTVIHCVNEEVALPLLLMKRVLFKKLVIDIFDSLGLRVRNCSNIVNKILGWLCNTIYQFSDLIIVTNQIRYDLIRSRYQKKTIVIENTIDGEPYASGPSLDNTVRLCVSGVLAKSRGLEQLLKAVEELDEVEIVSLGILADDFASSVFINHPKVKYLGFVAQQDGLRIASGCDAIYAYYEPSSINNIYASPNKIFDAMFIGKPIIINSETKVSAWIEEEQLGFSIPYQDTKKLSEALASLGNRDEDEQLRFQQRVQNLFKNQYSWIKMEGILHDAYSRLFY